MATRSAREPRPQQGLSAPPLVTQAREAILSGILDGRFVTRLPPEDEVAEMLDVSRTTVRAAVQDLERDGLLKRRRAIGTVINRHVGFDTLALQRLVGFDRLLEEKGHTVRVDISARRQGPDRFADRLPWADIDDLLVIDKHYFADEQLAIVLRDYLPWASLTRAAIPKRIEASLFDFSRRHFRDRIDHAVVRIVPQVNRGKDATQLQLEKGEPFVRLHETHFSANAQPVAWTFIDIDDAALHLEVFRSGI